MATGFPTKANWAPGDVLNASALDDLAGTVNLLSNASATTGSQLISNAAGTSFAYSATPSASNPVLNSSFSVWQRGTSGTNNAVTSAGYNADRWTNYYNGANLTVSRQATGDTTNLPNIQYCARVQRNSGQTSTNTLWMQQNFESVNSIPYAGKTVTLSFYARAGANYSAASSILTAHIDTGTGTDQNLLNGYTGNATPINSNVTLTTTWQRFSLSGTIATTATEMAISFLFVPTGTAGANDYYEVTGVQIDVGSVALPFRTNGTTLQGQLSACQRYYYRNGNGQTYSRYGLASYSGTTSGLLIFNLPVTMRALPTSVDYANLGVQAYGGAAIQAVTAVTLTGTGASGNVAELSVVSATGYGAGVLAFVNNNNNAAGYIGVSAEL